MKEPITNVALPRYPKPHSQSDKYCAIVQCMAHYTNILLDMSKHGDTCDEDASNYDINTLRNLEADLTELSGDDGSHGYLTETLEHLKATLLGNSHERYPHANFTTSQVPSWARDRSEGSHLHPSVPLRAEFGRNNRASSSSLLYMQPSTMCLFRQYEGADSEQCADEEESAGSECSSSAKNTALRPLETYPTASVNYTKMTSSEQGMPALSEDDIASEGEVSESDPSGTADSSSCDGELGGEEGVPVPSKKSKRLNKSATEFLTRWLLDHQDNPFPSPEEKTVIARRLNLAPQQVGNWMTNMRKRHLYPVIAGKRAPKTPLDFAVLERHYQHFAASTVNTKTVGIGRSGPVPSYNEYDEGCAIVFAKKGSTGDVDESDGGDGYCDRSSAKIQKHAQRWRHLTSRKREGEPFRPDSEAIGSKKPRLSEQMSDLYDGVPRVQHDSVGALPFLAPVRQCQEQGGLDEDSSSALMSCELGHDLDDMNMFERELWSSVATDGCPFSLDEQFPTMNGTCVDGDCEDLGWFDLIGLSGPTHSSGAHSIKHFKCDEPPDGRWEGCADLVAAKSEI